MFVEKLQNGKLGALETRVNPLVTNPPTEK